MRKRVLVSVVLCMSLVYGAEEQAVEKTAEKKSEVKAKREYNEHDARMWALGASAVLIERNHASHTTLAPKPMNERNIKAEKKLLSRWWGIESRQDLFNVLRRMDKGMHRASFEKLGKELSSLSEEAYEALLKVNTEDPEKLNEIKVARKYYKELGDKGLWGWDYSRDICLCRWGYMVGYISEEEAWKRIMAVARILQSKFDSWEDLGRNYLIGRDFWSYKYTQEGGYLYDDAVIRLIDMPSSPWNKYPWDLPLSQNAADNSRMTSTQAHEEQLQ